MKIKPFVVVLLSLLIVSCATDNKRGTIAELDNVQLELKDADIEGGLDKAMQSYQKFLEETPESQLTPEAIRRLADLKVEKEYGIVTEEGSLDTAKSGSPTDSVDVGESLAAAPVKSTLEKASSATAVTAITGDKKETQEEFEKRTTQGDKAVAAQNREAVELPKGEAGADLKNAGAEEAIVLYKKLLKKYPMYERNDQVLYQLSRAYEEIGEVDEAMAVMNQLVKQYPASRYNDEVQFRRGEYYFTRKKYLDAEDAYGEVLKYGVGTVYYESALYKKGWTLYKQELYEDALVQFFGLLDYKVSIGYDFEQTTNGLERKRVTDTFRVVSLSFSNLGGPETIQEFFAKNGARDYEHNVYRELAEFYLTKRRYNDAAVTYNTFIDSNPFHKKSPHFSMRVINIYLKGGFPRLVIDAKKQFASTYGLKAEYWNYFNQADFSEVLGYLKTNITDLANHYHSLYQNKALAKNKPKNFSEAAHWYREFLSSFPKDVESASINYQLAELFLENKDYKLAAIEYERSAYDYPVNDKSQKAAYAAVFSYREHLKNAPVSEIKNVKQDIIRVSIRLVDKFPQHEKATIVLGAAADDLFQIRDFTLAIKVGRRLIEQYPAADKKITRGAWLVVAHSSFQVKEYKNAELAYVEVLKLTSDTDKSRVALIDNLAASVYRQGELAKSQEKYKEAVKHFLRIAEVAPTSKIRPNAEYDAAAVLIQIMDLEQAIDVLLSFRENYPGNSLQHDVTKKIAYSYKELEKYTLAAKEYERVALEAQEEELIREAMLEAAELYEKAKDTSNSLRVYKQFVVKFPKPLEFALETHYKIAMIYKTEGDLNNYRKTLRHIIKTDAKAGAERTDRTRYLAAQSSLVIIEPKFDDFIAIKLVKPFKKSLNKKQKSMKSLVKSYTKLVDYGVADVTAASRYYVAEIYFNFSRSLMESEKPDDLSAVELEEFNIMIEEQAFPFEEKAIQVHETNIQLLASGIYSSWIDRSIEKLAKLLPARYAKTEESTKFISNIDNYSYTSPRFARVEESTGFIDKLDFYRYQSIKLAPGSIENTIKGDIGSKPFQHGGEGPNTAAEEVPEKALTVPAVEGGSSSAETSGAPLGEGNKQIEAKTAKDSSQTAIEAVEPPKEQAKPENPVTKSVVQNIAAKPENDVEAVKPDVQQEVKESQGE